MLSDAKAGQMFALLHQGQSVARIAKTLHMGERTIRKYRDQGTLPSQQPKSPRTYRTRTDPLEPFWPEIEEFLENDPRLRPVALLDWLKQKYNAPETGEGPISDSLRRTLERRVQKWKLQHGVQHEVKFPQVHQPGDVIAFDFVNLNGLGVTIGGRAYDHLLFHSVFTYSNWEHVHLCHSESFEALSTGLQDALHLAGGVPTRVRSDSTTTREFYDDGRGTNYAQARYLCYYLQDRGLLVKYYHAFVKNADKDPTGYDTLKTILGERDMAAFQKRWEEYVLKLKRT